ncbi:NAD(P)-binding protein [Amniculicola lignicola CBS 123094]|uniref:NAD(P)-binding protein n=1 Tax=Amniculicola lignicola CBS 123094 TaxID=1392246 RepID=A0A6A5X0P6_9PLEO|nr:NAD(P)-binding protein [Amniculicola lignicola CBS 123094]
MSQFVRKVVIITGCSSGIGKATTLHFLSQSAEVFGIDISPFNHTLEPSHATSFSFHQANLTEPQACDVAVQACKAKNGDKIDVLVNCAGVMDAFSSVDTLKDDEWDRVMSVNLTVPVKLMRAVLPSMKEAKGGAIVNVCSRASVSGASAGVAYTASKHGLLGATKNVAWRFHNEGIRCNAVLPGGVHTNMATSIQQENFDVAAFASYSPVIQLHIPNGPDGQLTLPTITVDDVAKAIAFLASDDARHISGAALPVDNAWSSI